jgi:hypothetical protein
MLDTMSEHHLMEYLSSFHTNKGMVQLSWPLLYKRLSSIACVIAIEGRTWNWAFSNSSGCSALCSLRRFRGRLWSSLLSCPSLCGIGGCSGRTRGIMTG